MDVTVVVPMFGELHSQLAGERALPSVPAGVPVIVCTGANVAEARHHGLKAVTTPWVVHLDADDELTAGYLDALSAGSGDVRVPAVSYTDLTRPVPREVPAALWRKDLRAPARHHRPPLPESCLCSGNWVPIGAMARTDLLLDVGGWHDHAWSEDWCLWLRCHLAGATFEQIPQAVYHAYTMPGGRNQAPRPTRNDAHREIAAENGIESTR